MFPSRNLFPPIKVNAKSHAERRRVAPASHAIPNQLAYQWKRDARSFCGCGSKACRHQQALTRLDHRRFELIAFHDCSDRAPRIDLLRSVTFGDPPKRVTVPDDDFNVLGLIEPWILFNVPACRVSAQGSRRTLADTRRIHDGYGDDGRQCDQENAAARRNADSNAIAPALLHGRPSFRCERLFVVAL